MKEFNKHILEAIHRGIKLALDDYQDIDPNSSVSNDVINVDDVIQNRIDLNKYTVDLGLPSGTRWCKYNLGCDFDLLNNHPKQTSPKDWYGDYYAWGELDPKEIYSWDTYKFKKSLTKYNNEDQLTQLLPEDDTAYQNMRIGNYEFHIPTKEQFEELFTIDYKFVKCKYVKNLYGIMFKGKNGNELFLPAAGYYHEYGYTNDDICFYWSQNSLESKDKVSVSYFYYANYNTASINLGYKSNGCSIRPVFNN